MQPDSETGSDSYEGEDEAEREVVATGLNAFRTFWQEFISRSALDQDDENFWLHPMWGRYKASEPRVDLTVLSWLGSAIARHADIKLSDFHVKTFDALVEYAVENRPSAYANYRLRPRSWSDDSEDTDPDSRPETSDDGATDESDKDPTLRGTDGATFTITRSGPASRSSVLLVPRVGVRLGPPQYEGWLRYVRHRRTMGVRRLRVALAVKIEMEVDDRVVRLPVGELIPARRPDPKPAPVPPQPERQLLREGSINIRASVVRRVTIGESFDGAGPGLGSSESIQLDLKVAQPNPVVAGEALVLEVEWSTSGSAKDTAAGTLRLQAQSGQLTLLDDHKHFSLSATPTVG